MSLYSFVVKLLHASLRFVWRLSACLWMASLFFSGAAMAECTSESSKCSAIGDWQFSVGLGLGGRSNPLVEGDDIPLFVLPKVSYYGERFFWESTTLGFTLVETNRQSINVVATVGFDQMYFNDLSIGNFVLEGGSIAFSNTPVIRMPNEGIPGGDADALDPSLYTDTETPNTDDKNAGPNEFFHKSLAVAKSVDDVATPYDISVNYDDLHSRKMAGLAGLEYSAYLGGTSVSVQLLQDFTSVHGGQEIRFGVDHHIQVGRNNYAVAAGAVWQDKKIVDYYYGLNLDEVHYQELTYTPSDSITPYVRLDWIRPIAKRWTLQATLHQKWFDDAITNSPLVEKHYSTSIFIGGVYHF